MTTLFLVENERSTLARAAGELRNRDLTVFPVTSVKAFHELLTASIVPDAVISDYYLDEGETGKQIWHATRGKYPKLPFIGTSSEVDRTW